MTRFTVFIAASDLAGLTRGRVVPSSEHDAVLRRGVDWVPINLAVTCFGPIADNPFGSTSDLRLMPDVTTRVEVPEGHDRPGMYIYLADQTPPDGTVQVCPGQSAPVGKLGAEVVGEPVNDPAPPLSADCCSKMA